MYKEYVNSIQTEIGQIDLIYPSDDEMQVWVNKVRIHVPPHWLKQTSSTIVRKVCQLVKTARNVGSQIGGCVNE